MPTAWLSLLSLLLLGQHSASFVFDAEEIKSLNYVVDILDQPVILSETPEDRTVQMYNQAGQAYSCQLPDTEGLLQRRRGRDEAAAQHAPVSGLLAPMLNGPCLQRTKDWWTYELCPMSEIRQYHMEGGQIVGKTTVLGRFESDFDWAQDDDQSRNAQQRYHSQAYVNGSDCDITSRPRSAEVRYFCGEGGGDALVQVDEPETCRYVLTVLTGRVCAHGALGPPASRRPQPVTCRPALSEEQMGRLEEARREREKRERERAERRAKEREEKERMEEEERERMEEEEEMEAEEEEEVERMAQSIDEKRLAYLKKAENLFDGIASQTKKLGDILDDVIHNYIHIVSEIDTEAEYGAERLHALRERHQAVRHHHAAHADRIRAFFELAAAGHYHTDQIVRDLIGYTGTLTVFSEVMVGISEESRRLKAFVSSAPSQVTDDILERLMRTVTSLSLLSVQLERFLADTEVWRKELQSWQTELDSWPESPTGPDGTEGSPGDLSAGDGDGPQRVDSAAQPVTGSAAGGAQSGPGSMTGDTHMDTDAAKVMDEFQKSRLSEFEDGLESSGEEDGPPGEGEEDLSAEEGSGGTSKKSRVKFSTLRSLGLDRMVQVTEIDKEQRARIERAVKRKLGKVGLDSNGPEIHVRFIKFPDKDHLDREHTLTDQQLAAFENALVAVMMGGSEALLEHEKHARQAKNYEFSFDSAVRSLETDQEDSDEETADVDESLFRLV